MLKVQLILVRNGIELFTRGLDGHLTNVVHFALLEQRLKGVDHIVKASRFDLALYNTIEHTKRSIINRRWSVPTHP